MNRQERREMERKSTKYEKRTHFTKAEVEAMNITAYDLGVKHTLEAAAMKCGIGAIRAERIKEGLKLLQILDFEYPAIVGRGKK